MTAKKVKPTLISCLFSYSRSGLLTIDLRQTGLIALIQVGMDGDNVYVIERYDL